MIKKIYAIFFSCLLMADSLFFYIYTRCPKKMVSFLVIFYFISVKSLLQPSGYLTLTHKKYESDMNGMDMVTGYVVPHGHYSICNISIIHNLIRIVLQLVRGAGQCGWRGLLAVPGPLLAAPGLALAPGLQRLGALPAQLHQHPRAAQPPRQVGHNYLMQNISVDTKCSKKFHPKVRNHGEGPY